MVLVIIYSRLSISLSLSLSIYLSIESVYLSTYLSTNMLEPHVIYIYTHMRNPMLRDLGSLRFLQALGRQLVGLDGWEAPGGFGGGGTRGPNEPHEDKAPIYIYIHGTPPVIYLFWGVKAFCRVRSLELGFQGDCRPKV